MYRGIVPDQTKALMKTIIVEALVFASFAVFVGWLFAALSSSLV
jgi:hypothetical protein